MYTAFYGLREKPFALSPDPRFLFLAEPHREALAHLLYGIEQGEGFIVITGEVGTGKTTLCRTLLRRLGADVEVAFLFNPQLNARELVEAVHTELGIESLGETLRELMDELNRFLLDKQHEGRRVLLIVDEAQGLAPQTLEQIRLLSNLETESQKLIQILLLGQPELDEMLGSPSLRQLRQRIGVRWRLASLNAPETHAYVRHRLRIAALSDRELFTEAALREVHRRSRGVPRLVNLLCDRALLAGYAARAPRIGVSLVRQAHRELQPAGTRRARRRQPRIWAAATVLALGLAALVGRLLEAPFPGVGRLLEVEAPRVGGPAPRLEAVRTAAPENGGVVNQPARARVQEPGSPQGATSTAASIPGAQEQPAEPEPAPSPGSELASPEESKLVGDLALALAQRPPGFMAAAALRAILAAWQLPAEPSHEEVVSFPKLLGELNRHDLAVLAIPRTDVAMLRSLDHPALLELSAADGVSRIVALRTLTAERASVVGLHGEAPVWVPLDQLERQWEGEAYVVWQDFEALPAVLRLGDAGTPVVWLQFSLRELGFYSATLNARFDADTQEAVRAFQQRRQLVPDGDVGPFTKMALYDALSRYPVPRLSSSEDVG